MNYASLCILFSWGQGSLWTDFEITESAILCLHPHTHMHTRILNTDIQLDCSVSAAGTSEV